MSKKIKENTIIEEINPIEVDEMEQFMTDRFQSQSQKLYLYLPNGQLSNHYLELIGIDSKVMRQKKKQLFREIAVKVKEKEFTDELQDEFSTKLLASSVIGWSFSKPCNYESVCEFLDKSPIIRDAVDIFINDNENYFKKK